MRRGGLVERGTVRLAVAIAAVGALTVGCTTDDPPRPTQPTPASTSSSASPSATAQQPPPVEDTDALRSYLTGPGAGLVTGLHAAAQQLTEDRDKATCQDLARTLGQRLSTDKAAALAAGVPDGPTRNLIFAERSAVGRTLTICLHPDKASATQKSAAKLDLTHSVSQIEQRLDAAEIPR